MASQLYSSILTDPAHKAHHPHALAGFAKCALAEKQIDVARDLLQKLKTEHAAAIKSDTALATIVASVDLFTQTAAAGATNTESESQLLAVCVAPR